MTVLSLSDADRSLVEEAKRIVRLRYVARWNCVGAALRTSSGKTYAAIHLDAAVGRVAVCAEMIALGMAVADGESQVETIVAVTRHRDEDFEVLPPCGMCRELLSDYAPGAHVIVPTGSELAKMLVVDLLPMKRQGEETYPPLDDQERGGHRALPQS
jgi:cytidine deaminase